MIVDQYAVQPPGHRLIRLEHHRTAQGDEYRAVDGRGIIQVAEFNPDGPFISWCIDWIMREYRTRQVTE